MLFKKRAAKIVAIAAAVLLLLVAAVTGTALVLRPTHADADAVGTKSEYLFEIEQPDGITLRYLDSIFETWDQLDYIISNSSQGIDEASYPDLVYLEKKTAENGAVSYIFGINESSKTNVIKFQYDTIQGGGNAQISVKSSSSAVTVKTSSGIISIMCKGGNWPEATEMAKISVSLNYTVSGPKDSNYIFTQVTDAEGTSPKPAATSYTVGAGPFYFTLTCKDPNTAIASVSADGQPLLPNEKGVYTLDVQEDVKISATYGYAVDVTVEGGEDGITRSVAKVAAIRQNFTFFVTPKPGNSVEVTAQVGEKTVEVQANGTNYTIYSEEITGKLTIKIKVSTTSYNVSYIYDGDAVKLSNAPETATYGGGLSLTLTLNKGYTWGGISALTAGRKPITISGSEPTADGETSAEFTIAANTINDNFTITISTSVGKYDVTAPTGDNFTFKGSTSAKYNTPYTFNVTPNTGYEIESVSATIGGDSLTVTGGNGSYTISGDQITGNITITVEVAKKTYKIELSAPDGCYFTAVGGGEIHSLTVEYGGDATFKIVAKDGYDISQITVTFGNESVKEVEGVYTLHTVTEAGTVNVKDVQKCSYNITLTSVDGYTISSNNANNNLTWGQKYEFSVTVNEGYDPEKYSVMIKKTEGDQLLSEGSDSAQNGSYYTKANRTYTITVKDNITVTLEVKDKDGHDGKLHYTVTDSIENSAAYDFKVQYDDESKNVAYYGTTVRITITAKAGYRVEKVTISVGNAIVTPDSIADNMYVVNRVTGNLSVEVVTHENELTVTYTGEGVAEKSRTYKYTVVSDDDGCAPEILNASYFNGVWKAGDETVANLNKYVGDLKGSDQNVILTASWSLNESALKGLLDFKIEMKSGEIKEKGGDDDLEAKLWIHLSNDRKHYSNDSSISGWESFLEEIKNRDGQVRALGFTLAAIQKRENHGVELNTANQNLSNYNNKILAGLSGQNITSQSALAQFSQIACDEGNTTYVNAYGVCFDNNANYFNYTLTSTSDKLTRRAISFWTAVELNGNLTVISCEFKMVQDWISSAAAAEVAILNSDPVQETYEEPAID